MSVMNFVRKITRGKVMLFWFNHRAVVPLSPPHTVSGSCSVLDRDKSPAHTTENPRKLYLRRKIDAV